ncbi:MAG: hypothetical protein EAZ13_02330 [Sphingobacteriia bacterium]|nr:MAG: hypothetical protein EAZ13_02330 [Sphingobacteriia bacterium]
MKAVVLLITLLVCEYNFAQIKITGIVKDSSGNDIESAVVRILKKNAESSVIFTMTNSKGFFELVIADSLYPKGSIITVNAFGFEKQIKPLEYLYYTFSLIPEPDNLPPVTVQSRDVGIRQKGDTINYTTTTFASKADRTIGDVLKKIPGIEIDQSGRIAFNGVSINYFYIDGDNLLDDRYNLATQSIPHEIVDKIQVIEKNQHIKVLSGIISSDKPGINITLKDKNKLNWINNVGIAGGVKNLASFELNAMVFKSKFKSLNVLKYNNIGQNISGDGMNGTISEAGNNGEINPPQPPILYSGISKIDFDDSRYLFNNSGIASLNSLLKNKTGLTYRINLEHISDKQQQNNQNTSVFNFPNTSPIEYSVSTFSKNHLKRSSGSIVLHLNSEKRYINIKAEAIIRPRNNSSIIQLNGAPIKQDISDNNTNLTLLLNGISLVGKKNFIEFFSESKYTSNPQKLFFTPGLFDSILNQGNLSTRGRQELILSSFISKNYISMRWARGNWVQALKSGFTIEAYQLGSNIFIEQMNGIVDKVGKAFQNNLKFSTQSAFAENELRWKNNNTQLSFSIPITINNISISDTLRNLNDDTRLLLIQPSFNWSNKINQKIELSAKYLFNNQFGNITQFNRGAVITDYREIGASELNYRETQSAIHQISTTFNFKHPIKIFFFNLTARYSFQNNNSILQSDLNSNINKTIALPLFNANRSFSVNSSASKYLFFARSTVSLAYRFISSNIPIFQNGLLFNAHNNIHFTSTSLTTKFLKYFTSSIKYSLLNSVSQHTGFQQRAHQITQAYSIEYIPQSSFLVKVLMEKTAFWRDNNKINSILFWDASAKFFIKKPEMQLELILANLGNIDSFNRVSIASNLTSIEQIGLRGRTALIKISFNLY